MAKTHEAIIIKSDSADMMQHLKIGCSQVKAKLNIHSLVKPVDWIPREYGYIVVVELPETQRSRKVSDVGNKSKNKG